MLMQTLVMIILNGINAIQKGRDTLSHEWILKTIIEDRVEGNNPLRWLSKQYI